MIEIYRTTVHDAGPLAASFVAEGLFVTFGADAPDALKEFCFIVDTTSCSAPIEVGQLFAVDEQQYPITAVGSVAQRNLEALGHITVNIDGAAEPAMDGAIHIRCTDSRPEISIGSVLTIEAA